MLLSLLYHSCTFWEVLTTVKTLFFLSVLILKLRKLVPVQASDLSGVCFKVKLKHIIFNLLCFGVWRVQRCAVSRAGAPEEDFLCLFTADNLSREEMSSARWSLKVGFFDRFTTQKLCVFMLCALWMLSECYRCWNVSIPVWMFGTVCELC